MIDVGSVVAGYVVESVLGKAEWAPCTWCKTPTCRGAMR
jgi:hypothetical protein